jgi:hypothetical protein
VAQGETSSSLRRPWPHLLKIAQFVIGDGQHAFTGTGVPLPLWRCPNSGRKEDLSLADAFLQHWRYENPIAQKELIVDTLITLVRENVFHGAYDWLAGSGGFPH